MLGNKDRNTKWGLRVKELLAKQEAEDQARLFGKPRIYFYKKDGEICKNAENR